MKKLFLSIFLFSSITFGMEESKKNVVFIGNPGMGKSSLINALFKKKVTKAGINVGTGLTYDLNRNILNGITFIDTPGLSDITEKEHAAKEIQKALDYKSNYKLFFVTTVEAARIRLDDIETMNVVMGAIKAKNKSFTIIINKIKKNEKRAILNDFANFKAYADSKLHTPTDNYLFIDDDHLLDDEDPNSFMNIDDSVKKYIFDDNNYFFINDLDAIDPDKKQKELEKIRLKLQADLDLAKEKADKAEKERKRLQAIIDEENRKREEENRKREEENRRRREAEIQAQKHQRVEQLEYERRMAILKATNDYHSLRGGWNSFNNRNYEDNLRNINNYFDNLIRDVWNQ